MFFFFIIPFADRARVRAHVAPPGSVGRSRGSSTETAGGQGRRRKHQQGHTVAQSPVHGVRHQGISLRRNHQRHFASHVGTQDSYNGIEFKGDYSSRDINIEITRNRLIRTISFRYEHSMRTHRERWKLLKIQKKKNTCSFTQWNPVVTTCKLIEVEKLNHVQMSRSSTFCRKSSIINNLWHERWTIFYRTQRKSLFHSLIQASRFKYLIEKECDLLSLTENIYMYIRTWICLPFFIIRVEIC